MAKMNLPNCSKCGREHGTTPSYLHWRTFTMKKPESNMPFHPSKSVYYVLCPFCADKLEEELQGYKKTKETLWNEV